nr:MAG TPA: RecT protein [Caudoviricetes sp.]
MNNELQPKGNNAVVVSQPTQVGFNFFDPVQFDTMQRVCKLFASSELVPDMYKVSDKNPIEKAMANCMIAIEIAQRIGASPLMVMQNMVPIYGKPSWSSKFLVATVNTCGRFNPLQYRFTEKGMLGMVDYTDYVWDNASRSKRAVTKQFDGKKVMDIECVAYTTAKGSDKMLESSPVSIRLAIQEGWYTKNGSKWQTMTKQMLMYRAASFWTSAYAPELSMGMKTVEENQEIQDVDYQEIKDNANKVQISMDLGNCDDKTVKAVVDTETGEIKNDNPADVPQAEQAQKSPGF